MPSRSRGEGVCGGTARAPAARRRLGRRGRGGGNRRRGGAGSSGGIPGTPYSFPLPGRRFPRQVRRCGPRSTAIRVMRAMSPATSAPLDHLFDRVSPEFQGVGCPSGAWRYLSAPIGPRVLLSAHPLEPSRVDPSSGSRPPDAPSHRVGIPSGPRSPDLVQPRILSRLRATRILNLFGGDLAHGAPRYSASRSDTT